MMAGIRGKNTKPELLLRKALHVRGFRYRLHVKTLPGKPDLTFPKYKAVIFVHGCFWHQHDCKLFKWPRSNATFWFDKITANVTRDKKHSLDLTNKGWRILIVWECALKRSRDQDFEVLIENISHWLTSSKPNYEISERNLYDSS